MEENPRASSSGESVVVLPAWVAHALAHHVFGEIWATAPDAVMPAYPTDDARRFVVSIDNGLAPLTAIILENRRGSDVIVCSNPTPFARTKSTPVAHRLLSALLRPFLLTFAS
jgi:hypothetical protein